jgi:5-methylthioribose kinase
MLHPPTPLTAWLLSSVASIWRLFVSKFTTLWDAEGLSGDLFPASVFGPGAPAGPQSLKECQAAFFARLFQEVLGFSGAMPDRRLGRCGLLTWRALFEDMIHHEI